MGLIVGLLARPLSLLGLLLMLAIVFASGSLLSPGGAVAFALIFLTLLLAGGSRVMGLDARLAGRLPSWMV